MMDTSFERKIRKELLCVIKLEHGNLSGMKSELQGLRDLSAFRHFEIGVFFANNNLSSKKNGTLHLLVDRNLHL